ncbi:hydrogenase maturation protease [Sporolituus thermophilus]|uniref:Hydrogenase maturation protease n=1 Tax=Sporolituus thermophilus DSM 23256 TaxID=1123285 RepID=A0A1G7JWC9_9FIRM|nr:hydrogenase maturation protease [Sporolituus thermophilus]SDF29151.1 hydrogenase maturation protease [Sporolituus thermophilus DSM 23256]
MSDIVVVGFGNLLMGDDGAGIRVVERLNDLGLPSGVKALDGGVASFEVLAGLRQAQAIIIVDAMAAGGAPGAVYRMTPADLGAPAPDRAFSLHEFTLLEALHLAAKVAPLPPVVIYGIEPASVELGLELTPPVAQAVERVANLIMDELRSELNA